MLFILLARAAGGIVAFMSSPAGTQMGWEYLRGPRADARGYIMTLAARAKERSELDRVGCCPRGIFCYLVFF